MSIIKRYWNALDEASRKALKKAAFLALGMELALLLVMFLVYFDVFFLGTMGDAAPTQFALMPAFMLGAIAIAIYSYVLAYRAHRAIKENLFAHPTPGLRTRETWTHADGFLLALALIGIVSIPSAVAGLIMDFFLSSSPPSMNRTRRQAPCSGPSWAWCSRLSRRNATSPCPNTTGTVHDSASDHRRTAERSSRRCAGCAVAYRTGPWRALDFAVDDARTQLMTR